MRTLVLGDVHGAYRALMQVLERSKFDYDQDRLIFLGDVADGWPEVKQCIDEFLKMKNLVPILGNHDEWFEQGCRLGPFMNWVVQGGNETIRSYGGLDNVPLSHVDYLRNAKLWYEQDGKVFVHGGFDPRQYIHPSLAPKSHLLWDRELNHDAWLAEQSGKKATEFDEVYIGHTATYRRHRVIARRPSHEDSDVIVEVGQHPVCMGGVWNLDQGAGWDGYLTIMDVDTKEFWQSDRVPTLYPEKKGRAG